MKTFFAVFDDSVGIGNTLDEALQELQEHDQYARLNDVTFYEGTEIKVELQIRNVIVKAKAKTIPGERI